MKMEDLAPGSTHTLTGFMLITPYGNLTHSESTLSGAGYITVAPHDITFTIPEDFNAVQEAVKAVDAEMDKERADLAEKLQRLQAKKNELLQISFAGNVILDAE